MFRSYIVGIAIGLILIAGGAWYVNGISTSLPAASAEGSKPWVEIISGKAFESNSGTRPSLRELKTGDEIEAGSVIDVREGGRANVYFFDGSVLRIDSGTTITISEASFDESSHTMVVKISLSIGRVWSKIVGLATPDSQWEVRTSDAVATVRGTAFGMMREKGKSSVIGSQHAVEVHPIDPKTLEIIADAKVIVEPDKMVTIEEKDIPAIKEGRKAMIVQAMTEAMKSQEWVQEFRKRDEALENVMETMREKVSDAKEFRTELRKKMVDEFKDEIKKRRIERENEKRDEEVLRNEAEKFTEGIETRETSIKEEITTSETVNTGTRNTVETQSGGGSSASAKPTSLSIIPKRDLKGIIEGNLVAFDAVLKFSDGSTKTVTSEATWRVVGGIGKMERPGVFRAQLDDSVAEFGTAPGSVAAQWKGEDGSTALGASPIFNVDAKIEEILDTRG